MARKRYTAEENIGRLREAAPELPAPGSQPRDWIGITRGEIGVTETPGSGSTSCITECFTATELGQQPDSVPSCSAFVNWVMREAGLPTTGSAMARSWADYGRDAGGLVPGCIVVLSSGDPPAAHVGFYVGEDGRFLRLLGGNQSDAVNTASFQANRLIAHRQPA